MWLVTNVLDSLGPQNPNCLCSFFSGDTECHFYFKMICNVIHMMKFGSSFLQSDLNRIVENQIVGASMNESFCFIVPYRCLLAKVFITLSNICAISFSSSLGCSIHPISPIMSNK